MHKHLQVLEQQFSPSLLTQLVDPLFDQHGVELWIKRDDLLHSIISGNKWRKLKYSLDHALKLKVKTIVSMGGPYSNHLHALAFAGKLLGLETRAFIRGEKPKRLSPTLTDIQNWGMTLSFVSRSEYRELRNYKQHNHFPGLKSDQYWLPEGGATERALQGIGEIISEITIDYDVLCTPCGTGATLAGLITTAPDSVKTLGIAALKGAEFLVGDVRQLLPDIDKKNWQILLDYHCGGFAKSTQQLRDFIEQFERQQGIVLDQVYTGKMFFALYDLLKQGYFKKGQRIIALHTGGLQGNRLME